MLVKWSEQETELGVIGRVGENNTRKIEIDCAETLEKLPGAEIICVMLRPGDETPYTLPLEANGNKRTIVLTDTDLERRGTIRIELRAVEDGSVLKSAILRGTVADSIRGEGDAPGQPVRDVLDRVDDTLKAAEATRKELETALGGVQGAVDAATGAADAATEAATAAEETDAQIKAAEKGRVKAEQERVAAEKKREQDTTAAVKSITDTVTDVQNKLESGAFNGAPGAPGATGKDGKDAPQIDDTTISDAAPWSSQHIVDMLCPPLTESGNPVVCYPVAGSTLGVTASWEPTQEGTGTPYPAGGGPNLLDISQCQPVYGRPFGLTVTIDGDIIKVNGIPSSEITEEGDYGFAVATCAQAELQGKGYKVTAFATKGNVTSAWGLRTETEDSIAVSAKLTPGVNTDIQVRLMVSKDTPTTYGPYANIRPIRGRNNVSITRQEDELSMMLALPSTIYGADLQADGTGQETWRCIESYAGEALPAGWICDRAVYADGVTPPTGAQVAYKLATPIPFSATGGGAIKALPGVNTILTDADTLTVTGRADPIHIIQQLQAASAASAQAIADDTMEITQEEAIQEENEKGMNG